MLSDKEPIGRVRDLRHRDMISGERGGSNYHFTNLSPYIYPCQYFWDTCLHIFTFTALNEVVRPKSTCAAFLFTGQGHGATDFTWSGLVVDMIKRQRELGSS